VTSSSEISSLTDLELIARYKSNHDKTLIGVLFKRYTHLVFGVCLKYLKDEDDSKDAVMEIFEKLFSDLLKHEVTYFKSWLHRVSSNHCLMKLRSSKGKYRESLEEDSRQFEVVEMNLSLHPDNSSEKEAMLRLMETGISTLNDEQRKCVQLFYIEEKSYKEVSDLTGYDMLKVKSYIQNGKRNLKLFMEKNNARQA